MKNDPLMTRNAVMEYLQISHGTLTKLMKQRAFPFMKLEKKVLFRKSDIDNWLESKMVR